MLESMTGFGRGERTDEQATVLVEVRSVNGRYLKVQLRVPEELASREGEIERCVRSRVRRGTVAVTIHLKAIASAAAWQVNTEVVRAYAAALDGLRREMGETAPIRLEALAALPGAIEAAAPTDRGEAVWALTAGTLDEALDRLLAMRRTEGEALARALLENANEVARAVAAVADRAPGVVEHWRDRFRGRVQDLVADAGVTISEADVAREVAFFAERCDIAEELNRLRSHLEQFRATVDGAGKANGAGASSSAGRTLEFITQEMLREANTIAAKANDAEIAHEVVRIKGELDRMKEQVQNVA